MEFGDLGVKGGRWDFKHLKLWALGNNNCYLAWRVPKQTSRETISVLELLLIYSRRYCGTMMVRNQLRSSFGKSSLT